MESAESRSCCSVFKSTFKVVGTSAVVPIFLSLTYFTQNIRQEHYAYGIIAAGTLLGLSLHIIGYMSKESEENPKSLGDLSRNVSTFLTKAVDIILLISKYMTLLIIIDIFTNMLFIYFPFLDEIRGSLAVYKILFGLGLALIGLTLYVFSTGCQSIFLILSFASTLVFSFALIVGYFLGVNSALPKSLHSPESPLPSFFWATALAFYTMEFISGGVKVVGRSTNTQPPVSRYTAVLSALIISAIYLIMIFSGGWIRSKTDSLNILDLIFSKSSKLNHYLRTSTIDRYAITSTVMCICLPVICITLFVIQFDIFIESLKNLANTENESKLWTLSLLILGILCTQALFSEIIGSFHFYLMIVVIGVTPLLANYPFLCYILKSKKITFLVAICILAILFICAVMVGTIRTLMSILQKD